MPARARKPTRKPATLSVDDVNPSVVYRVENPDPEKFYVWAAVDNSSADQYELSGYEYVLWPPEGDQVSTRVPGKRGQPGTQIQRQALVLMCIDRSKRQAIEEAGLRRIAERKARISSKRQPLVDLPGDVQRMTRGGDDALLNNETSAETTELV